MANEIESISYIKIGASNHPIDAVTFQGNEVSSFVSKSVNDLTNYYNKTEIEGLMGALINFHYEIYASTASVSEPENNVLYLIGPSGQGDDKYEEYIYPDETTGWVKIGDTTLDLSGYVTGVTFNGSAATVSNGTVSISESDPVFASSVAYSISSADITNWNSKTSNTGTLTGVKFNGTSASVSNGVASISVSIPAEVTESTVTGWGFTKNTGTLTSHASGFGQIIVTNTSAGTGAPTGDGSNISASEATEAINFTPSNKWVVLGVEQGWDPGENVLYIGHSLNGTGSGTAGTTSNTSGNSISIPYVNYDAAGHVTSTGTRTHTVSLSESDPVFSASPAAGISAADITNWNSKTSNTGTLTGVTFNGTSASISNGIASISVSIPSAVTESTVSGWGFTKNTGTLTGITVNGSSATVTNGVAEISVATSGMPSVTSADNGKILQVMSGSWTLTNPISIYTGSESPNNSTGINGDIYLQS